MKITKQRRALAQALHDVTFSLLGLFELHNANPALVEATGEVLTLVVQHHMQGPAGRQRHAAAPLRNLVNELGSIASA